MDAPLRAERNKLGECGGTGGGADVISRRSRLVRERPGSVSVLMTVLGAGLHATYLERREHRNKGRHYKLATRYLELTC